MDLISVVTVELFRPQFPGRAWVGQGEEEEVEVGRGVGGVDCQPGQPQDLERQGREN